MARRTLSFPRSHSRRGRRAASGPPRYVGRSSARGALLLCGALLAAAPLGAEEGPIKSGVRGRVVVAKELLSARQWPIDEERASMVRTPARIRRPAGRGAPAPLLEPTPALLVVLEGARDQAPVTPRVVVEGMRFVPGQLVVAKPGTVTVENRHSAPISLLGTSAELLAEIAPGDVAEVTLPRGMHVLSLREMPFATASVRVLDSALFLPFDDKGDIPSISVEGGDYQLSFYLGARALRVQPLTIPDDRYVAVDATVSAHGVVTVSIRDGALRVAVPQQRIAPKGTRTPAAADDD